VSTANVGEGIKTYNYGLDSADLLYWSFYSLFAIRCTHHCDR